MKKLVILIFLLLAVLVGGLVTLSTMDPPIDQQTVKEEIKFENL